MKKVFVLLILLVSVSSAYAQINFGPRVALVQTKVSLKNDPLIVTEDAAATGYQLGVFMRASLLGLTIQPELLYTQTKSGYSFDGVGSYQLEFDKIDLPIMIGYQLGPVRLQGGPTFSLITESKREQPNGTILFIRDSFSTTTLGYQAGVGTDFKKFVIDLKYERDLTNLGNDLGRGFTAEQRQYHFILAVGYKIF